MASKVSEIRALLCRVYAAGYAAGHEDTVEGCVRLHRAWVPEEAEEFADDVAGLELEEEMAVFTANAAFARAETAELQAPVPDLVTQLRRAEASEEVRDVIDSLRETVTHVRVGNAPGLEELGMVEEARARRLAVMYVEEALLLHRLGR